MSHKVIESLEFSQICQLHLVDSQLVNVTVTVGVSIRVSKSIAVWIRVTIAVWVTVAIGIAVWIRISVAVWVTVSITIAVWISVTEAVAVWIRITIAVWIRISVVVTVTITVRVTPDLRVCFCWDHPNSKQEHDKCQKQCSWFHCCTGLVNQLCVEFVLLCCEPDHTHSVFYGNLKVIFGFFLFLSVP